MLHTQDNFTQSTTKQRELLVQGTSMPDNPTYVGTAGVGVCRASVWSLPNGTCAVFKPPDHYFDDNNYFSSTEIEIMMSSLDTDILKWDLIPAAIAGGVEGEYYPSSDELMQIFDDGWDDDWWPTQQMRSWMEEYGYSDRGEAWEEFLDVFGDWVPSHGGWQEGSWHYLIPAEAWYYHSGRMYTKMRYNRGWARMHVLDCVTGQGDRHDGNYLWDNEDGRVWAIDNARCFRSLSMTSERYLKGGLDLPPDPTSQLYNHMLAFSIDATCDLLENETDFRYLLEDVTDVNISDKVMIRTNALHKLLMAAHEQTAESPPKGMVTVMLGEYRFDETPKEIERWIKEGWAHADNCNCYKCQLIKQYLKEKQ